MTSDKMIYGEKSSVPKIGLGQFFFQCLVNNDIDNICQLDVVTGEKETYKSVKERSVRAAIALAKKGVTSEDIICYCSVNTLDQVIATLAVFFLGAKVANLEPRLSVDQTRHLLSIVTPKVIFVHQDSLNLIENSLNTLNFKPEIVVLGEAKKYTTFDEFLMVQPNEKDFKPTPVDVEKDVALILFSSGTTGLPKAICHSHYSSLACLFNSNGGASGVFLYFSSMYWISGLLTIGSCLRGGATIAFASRSMSGEEIFKAIEKYRINGIVCIPMFMYDLTEVPHYRDYDTSSMRVFVIGGLAWNPQLMFKLEEIFENVRVFYSYGMSESGIISHFDHNVPSQSIRDKIEAGTCGKLLNGTILKIVDPDTEAILGANQKGEVRVKTNALMLGYSKADISNPFDPEDFLKTGDIGYYDNDGYLYLVDRIRELFKYKLFHIVPSEIEIIFLEHPAVKDAVVFGVPCGKDGEMPCAWVVLRENHNIYLEGIEDFLEGRLSNGLKLTGGITIVKDIPRTVTGKLMRKEVRRITMESIRKSTNRE